MKRKMAFLLAAALTLSSGFMAYAMGPNALAEMRRGAGGVLMTAPEESDSGTEVLSGIQTQDVQAGTSGEDSGAQSGISGTEIGDHSATAGTDTQPGNPDTEGTGTTGGSQSADPDTEGTGTTGGSQPADPDTEGTGTIGGSQPADPDTEGTGTTGGSQPADPDTEGTGTTGGSQPADPDTEGTGTTGDTQPPASGEEDSGTSVVPENTGSIEISIGAVLSMGSPMSFNVGISGPKEETQSVTLGTEEGATQYADFGGLPDGTYTITVSGDRFAAYTQTIDVKGMAYTLSLVTGEVNFEGLAGGRPGILVIGDVTGDGKVDGADSTVLVDAIDTIDGNDGGQFDASMDLNGDGTLDLIDLEYLAKGLRTAESGTLASVGATIPADRIKVNAESGTKVDGDLANLLQNEGKVALSPAQGGDITEANPVSLQFEIAGELKADGILIGTEAENPISKAVAAIEYIDEDGSEQRFEFPLDLDETESYIQPLLKAASGTESGVYATRDEDGSIRLYLGTQVAVKRVTLTIQGMKMNKTLAEISKVEFVNGMENRIPEPDLDIPQNLEATPGNAQFSLKWDPCQNVTGYEVRISQGDQQETRAVVGNGIDILSFNNGKLVNYQEYTVEVQAVNGTWRSGYCESKTVIPIPSGKPDKPDMVKAVGRYQSVDVSWKDMKDTLTYNVYYKESEGEDTYQKVEGIETNSYSIKELKDLTEYSIYVTGVNEFGESGPSLTAIATTTDLNPAEMMRYKQINIGESGEKGSHIVSTYTQGQMIDSPLDTDSETRTAWGTVDHDGASHSFFNTWDMGGFNNLGQNGGLIYEFDEAYMMDRFAFHDLTSRDTGYFYVKVRYWDEDGVQTDLPQMHPQQMRDAQDRLYYLVKFPQAASVKKLQFGIGRYSASGTITIAEVAFYHYDSLFDDIMGLYEDDLHTVLKAEVTQGMIDDLRERINTPDEVSGEYHPDRVMLERELKNAEDILNAVNLSQPILVHNTITTRDVGRGFGGLNAWQPLGISAAAGEKIVVYVGHNTKRTGDGTNLQLVATQYNAEASGLSRVVQTLKVGANEIIIPKIWSLDFESGGALYVQYTGNDKNDRYAVRVSGGVQVPVLDLYQVTDKAERLEKTKAYLEKLEDYVNNLAANHEKYHHGEDAVEAIRKYAYSEQTCILGAADILLDTMMFSLPASQIWKGSGVNGTSLDERAKTLLDSMDAMENMMYLFYQHKGLNNNAPNAVDKVPVGHLNIRYQRMFAGAFMYASGNHIGIGWGSTYGMVQAKSVVVDADGKWESGRYFGWGIAHEIGHCINQGSYAVAEVTNNYFSVLAQAQDNNDSVRFKYENVYQKVTSGTKGRASNVFTQLGMYWQLHLAYDNGYNYKTYTDYEEQKKNLFFARVDSYSRTPGNAPSPGGVALTVGSGDQALMRLSCAAAERNLLDFFERWGMTPDGDTIRYAEQFPEETRAIYYGCDDARVYRLTHSGSSLNSDGTTEAVGNVTAELVGDNQINLSFSARGIPQEDILGYEIVRCTTAYGEVKREPVGFTTGSEFSDVVATMNNRTVFYEITLVDKYLNRSAAKVLDPVKIQHDGSLDKSSWTVSTENLTTSDIEGTVVEGDTRYCTSDSEEVARESDKLIDYNTGTVFTAAAGGSAEITLEFHKTMTVAGYKVTGANLSGDYKIQVRTGEIWQDVAEGNFGTEAGSTVYFVNADGKYVATYAASAVKLSFQASGSVAIAELDVLGPTGDNVDFRRTENDNSTVIGKLAEDYQYGDKPEDVIPKDSIVFAGAYKGNAAYNVVVLYDQNGNVVGGMNSGGELVAKQIIMADVPEEGNIRDVTDGVWIYWLEPGTQMSGVSRVRAELYRVNNAQTNEGERLVSDSLFEEVPGQLPEVHLSGIADPWKK